MQVSECNTEISEDFRKKLKLNVPHEEQGENEEDFSFAFPRPGHSPVSADDAFHDGQIRPIFPVFDQRLLYRNGNGDGKDDSTPLRKLFVEEHSEPVGPFCEWSSGGNKTIKEASPEPCKKGNSTGFSKLRRFREIVLRSNSDGKDAFVFLNNSNTNNIGSKIDTCEGEKTEKSSETTETGTKTTPRQKTSKGEKAIKVTSNNNNNNNNNNKGKAETASSVYEKYYARNRVMREGTKRRSYAPYRQDLLGFFPIL